MDARKRQRTARNVSISKNGARRKPSRRLQALLVSRIVLLDSGPLGALTHPRALPEPLACRQWLKAMSDQGTQLVIPEIADYEIRRELLRAGKAEGLARLDSLKTALSYAPLTTAIMLRAAQFWAQARR